MRALLAGIAATTLWLAGPACAEPGDDPLSLPDSQLEPIKWTAIEGWAADDHKAAFDAFQTSCQAFRKVKQPRDQRPVYNALWEVCRRAATMRAPANARAARAFFEDNFRPVRITKLGDSEGFLTGYYEPIVQGSRFPSPEFHVPLHRRPPDLIAAGHKQGADNFPNKGVQVGRRNEANEIVPYHDRGAIEAGALDGQKLEICWLRNPFDLLAIQIEGSGRVILIESLIAGVFIVAASVGFRRSLWLVAAGLAAHGVMDFFHGRLVANPGVPAWWPAFCGAYDVAAAGYLAWRLVRGPARHARVA